MFEYAQLFDRRRQDRHFESIDTAHEFMEDLDFGDLRWQEDEQRNTFSAELPITLGAVDYILSAERSTQQHDGTVNERYDFTLRDEEGEQYIGGCLRYKQRPNTIGVVEAAIERFDREAARDGRSPLPHGSGIAFYRKMLDYLTLIADAKQQRFVHMAQAEPQDGMSLETWTTYFAPELLEHGYTEISPGQWEKVYEPLAMN